MPEELYDSLRNLVHDVLSEDLGLIEKDQRWNPDKHEMETIKRKAIGENIQRIADALERIADCLENQE